jgi:tripartite-type tricarboxylate transporter receptor subunit TctC
MAPTLNKREFLVAAAAGATSMLASAGTASAQVQDAAAAFPSRVVRIAVQSGPGGPPDIRMRQIASKLQPLWGHPVIVENRPGGGGLLALEYVAHVPADGHTLLFAGQGPFVVTPHLRKMSLDPLTEFVPVTQLGISPVILLVNPALPLRSVADLVDHAKRHPGQLNAATPGPGSTNQLALDLFARTAGISFTHVPYKDGVGNAITDLTAGRTQVACEVFTSHGVHVKNGQLRALAVSGRERLAVLPEVPTFSEAGLPEVGQIFIWGGFFARAGTPRAILERLHRALTTVMQLPDVKASLIETGSTPIGNTPEEFAAAIRTEHARYGKLIAESGIKLE